MTAEQLQEAERSHQHAQHIANLARQERNAAIRHAIAEGWTHQRIRDALAPLGGPSRARIGAIALSKESANSA